MYLPEVVQLSAVLPDNALQLSEQALPPRPKVPGGRGRRVCQHYDVACEVLKALHSCMRSARARVSFTHDSIMSEEVTSHSSSVR